MATAAAQAYEIPEDAEVFLYLVSADAYSRTTVDLVRQLVGASNSIVYVSINKPAQIVARHFEAQGIDTKRVFFIDCATASVSGESARDHNTLYVSPQNLTGLSLAINELLAELPENKAVVFDSLSTLTVYNPMPMVEKFTHFIANKIRLNNANGLLMSTADIKKELLALLEEVCDKIVRGG